MRQNIGELLEIIKFSKNVGLDGITFKPITISNVKFNTSANPVFEDKKIMLELWPTRKQLPKLMNLLDKFASWHEKNKFIWDKKEYFEIIKKYFLYPSNRFIGITCKKGYNYFVLDKEGYILPCWGMRVREEWHIDKISLDELWNSKEYDKVRKIMEKCSYPCTDMLECKTHPR